MDLIPKGFEIKKHPAFEPISKDLTIKWNNALSGGERNLVRLLLHESSNVVERAELDLDLKLKRVYPEDHANKRLQLNKNDKQFQKNLDKCCLKKWNNIKQKKNLSEKTSADNNTTENLDIEKKEVQEESIIDFDKYSYHSTEYYR